MKATMKACLQWSSGNERLIEFNIKWEVESRKDNNRIL